MKNIKIYQVKNMLILSLMALAITSCERDPSDEAVLAGYPKTAEVFIDGFSGGLEYWPFAGSKLDAFTVETDEVYAGSSSMRFDVPNFGDPAGAFAGAVFPDTGGRDLSGFDALTFWAKSSKAATINEIGFGTDFGEDKYTVVLPNMRISTTWTKYIIPIPDPSKLTSEKGMFWYAEGPENGDGYTFWIDELKYENLGTIAHPRPAMQNGIDEVQTPFVGSTVTLSGLTQTFNLASGLDQTVVAAPSYFTFESSNTSVATVSDLGVVSILDEGTAVITASLGGVDASGSLTVNPVGGFTLAPDPTRPASDVISVFSDTYPALNDFTPAAFNNSSIGIEYITFNNNDFIEYSNLLFVGMGWTGPLDVTGMTHLHVDIQIDDSFGPGDQLTVEILDFGSDGVGGTGDDTAGGNRTPGSSLQSGNWVGLDIPLTGFTLPTGGGGAGNPNLNNIGNVIFVAADKKILVDNVYFYK